MSGGCERRGGLGSLIASSNYTKKRAPRNGCRESGAPLACGLHGATFDGATFDPRALARVQPVDQRVGRLDRRGGRHLDRAPLLSDRGIPHPVSEHGEHAARRRFPDRKSTRLNSSHGYISYAVFCLKKKKNIPHNHSIHITTPHTQLSAHTRIVTQLL